MDGCARLPFPFSIAEATQSKIQYEEPVAPGSWRSSPGSPFSIADLHYLYHKVEGMVQHPLLTAVEEKVSFALDYLIRWDYIINLRKVEL